jgi:putative hemolysin
MARSSCCASTPRATARVTEEEIAASLEEGVDAGLIEEQERQMVQNVFQLDDRPLTSMMLPRSDIKWLEAGDPSAVPAQGRVRAATKRAHSWYPVCRGSLDDVVGKISVGKLLQLGWQHPGSIEPHVQSAVFVPETLSGMELLEQFRDPLDPHGAGGGRIRRVQGLITPNDLLEAITGELQPGTCAGRCLGHAARGWLLAGRRRDAGGRAQGAAGHRRACRTRSAAATTRWPGC